MALRNIREEGDSILLKTCRPVTDFNRRLHTLLDDMRDTLLEADGVGLAAPQVGILRRVVIVMDTNKEELTPEEQIIELINPQIISCDGEQTGQEGCLSVPRVRHCHPPGARGRAGAGQVREGIYRGGHWPHRQVLLPRDRPS